MFCLMDAPPGAGQTPLGGGGGDSLRTPHACEPCRSKKSKCDGQRPTCSTCRLRSRPCHYQVLREPRRPKHWDQRYVKSLEDQVKHLSESLKLAQQAGGASTLSPASTATSSPQVSRSHSYSEEAVQALKNFSSLSWNLKTPAGETRGLFTGPGRFTVLSCRKVPTFDSGDSMRSTAWNQRVTMSPNANDVFISQIKSNLQLKQHLKERFLDCINVYYRFVDPLWLQFSDLFPENDMALQLLYSAFFAAAAYSSPSVSVDVARGFFEYAERLAQQCFLDHLSLPVLKALTILAWLRHSLLDTRRGDLYNYWAIGMSTHLDIPVSSEPADSSQLDTVATVWSLYLVDRTSTPRLGFGSSIPWDMSEVPSYLSFFSPDSYDTQMLVFEYHCRLARIQERYIEPMYTRRFKSLPILEQTTTHSEAVQALVVFRSEIDRRLFITRRRPPHKTQILFWITYNVVMINAHRPRLDPDDASKTCPIEVSLEATVEAAREILRLARKFHAIEGMSKAPACVARHLMRAGLAHALGAAVYKGTMGKTAWHDFWTCMRFLGEMKSSWPTITASWMKFLVYVAKQWGLDVDTEYDFDECIEDDIIPSHSDFE